MNVPSSSRLLLALDVDGTVLPFLPKQRPLLCPQGFHWDRALGFGVWVPDHLCVALPLLAERFEIVWVTDWEKSADQEVSPLVGLPTTLPILPKQPSRRWKLDAVAAYAGERPLVWADDQMTSPARRWAGTRSAPTLLLKPNRWRGLSTRQVAAIDRFASAQDA